MMERNEVGKKVRKYFIKAENELRKRIANESPKIQSFAEVMLSQNRIVTGMLEGMVATEKALELTKQDVALLRSDVDEIKDARERAMARQEGEPELEATAWDDKAKCNWYIRRYAAKTGQNNEVGYKSLWNRAYENLYYADDISARQRGRNRRMNPIDTLSPAELERLLAHIIAMCKPKLDDFGIIPPWAMAA
jgi:hypothetical protein